MMGFSNKMKLPSVYMSFSVVSLMLLICGVDGAVRLINVNIYNDLPQGSAPLVTSCVARLQYNRDLGSHVTKSGQVYGFSFYSNDDILLAYVCTLVWPWKEIEITAFSSLWTEAHIFNFIVRADQIYMNFDTTDYHKDLKEFRKW